ncbi:MFS transporter [Amycolatopsis sp. NPDC059027]|uniref:MFS transporter n=1 Tax=Amycolatopsis sp. NPDC059027 TaxID=3346709 RepID=UPI0036733B7F
MAPSEHFVPPRARTGRAWTVTVLVLLFLLINYADKTVVGLAAEPIMKDLGLGERQYALVQSSFYFLFSVSGIVVGFAAAKRRSTRVMVVLALVWGVTALPVAAGLGLAALIASRIALGAAEGPAVPAATHTVYGWFRARDRALPNALVHIGPTLGVVASAPLLSWIIADFGYRTAFGVLFALSVVWSAVWLLIARDGPYARTSAEDRRAASPREGAAPVPYRVLFLSGTVIGAVLTGFVAFWATTTALGFLPRYLSSGLGIGRQQAGTLTALPPLLATVVILAMGAVATRLRRGGMDSRRAYCLPGMALLAVSGATMILFPHTEKGMALVLITVAFGLPSAFYPMIWLLIGELVPPERRLAVTAATTAIATSAGVFAPLVMGGFLTADRGYAAGFGVCGGLLLAGAVLGAVLINPARDLRRLTTLAPADESTSPA